MRLERGNIALENVKTWYWTSNTYIQSVTVDDVDNDGKNEIITGGNYYDGNQEGAQLCVWNGENLSLQNVRTWHWSSSTLIVSVAVGDVDGDGKKRNSNWRAGIARGTGYISQLSVWNGATMALKKVRTWDWTG